jgi:Mg-chelatase subunit ChlD
MLMHRTWALKRRLIYGGGVMVFLLVLFAAFYATFIYKEPSCFDGLMNGAERGIDCGGACELVCSTDVLEPKVLWAQSFEIIPGVYNAVGYVENRNLTVGTEELAYSFKLTASDGTTIVEKKGTTFLPPDSVYPIFEGRIDTQGRQPARTFLTLAPVSRWEEFTSTRGQFTVGERALRDVDARPRLDAKIINNALTDSREVEVVATIFDQKGIALTSSRTVVPLFEGRTTKDVVFTWPQPIAKTLRSCEIPTDVVLAIDLSGSMNNDGGTPPEPITSSLKAAANFTKQLKTEDQIGITTFATEGALVRTLSGDKTAAAALIEQLAIDPKEERGSTNLGDAISLSTTEFASVRHSDEARKVLILFTDGKATAPDPDPNAHTRTAADAAKAADITVFTIGLGNDLDTELLKGIATSPEHAYTAADTRALAEIYRSITSAICEDGPAVIDIVPKIIGDLNDGR